jgi:hypothetical protein
MVSIKPHHYTELRAGTSIPFLITLMKHFPHDYPNRGGDYQAKTTSHPIEFLAIYKILLAASTGSQEHFPSA